MTRHVAATPCAPRERRRQWRVPIAVIAAWLGHANAAFTLNTYAHSQADALQAARIQLFSDVTIRDIEAGSNG
jgi:integrase